MFHSIPTAIAARMRYLEAQDAQDRQDGTPLARRLRQIPPETGQFLAILAASAPDGDWLEIGTSAGYSSLWLALAAAESGRRLTTFEVLPEKVALARETFEIAGVNHLIALEAGDARARIDEFVGISFCFLDAEKEMYGEIYELVVPRLVPGGLLLADNVTSHAEALQPVVDRALSDARVDAVVVPIGKGVLVCRKT